MKSNNEAHNASTKACARCGLNLPLLSYYKSSCGKLSYHCKKCEKERKKKYYFEHREQQIKRALEYNKKNLPKLAVAARLRYSKNPKKKENKKKWQAKNPERLRLYDSKKHAKRRAAKSATIERITIDQWNSIKAKQKDRCFYCSKKKKLTQDHIVALSRGGDHSVKNIVAACGSCNTSKFNNSIEEFAKRKGRLFF